MKITGKARIVYIYSKKALAHMNSTTKMMQHVNQHHSEKLQSAPSETFWSVKELKALL